MKKLLIAVLALACLTGCSSQSSQPAQAEKPKPKPAEFDTGRVALQRMNVAAHAWARDAQPFRLQSLPTSDSNGHDGKSGVWRASFASPSGGGMKPYTWAGTDTAEGLTRGVTPGSEDSYSATNASTQVFDMAYLKTDTDQALQVAQKHGGDKLLEKSADTPVIFVLDWSKPTSILVWHVAYGTSRDVAKLTVDVNASTGEFIRVEK
jgi:hypothetical protein